MADARIKFIVELVDKFSPDAKKAKETLDRIDASMKKVTGGFGLMEAGAAAAGVAMGVKFVKSIIRAGEVMIQFGRDAAALTLVDDRLERLAAHIGTTADVLMDDMREAMGGLKSDAEIAAGAVDILSLGLAKNREDAVRLASAAGKLNMDMNQLVLTLTNMTTMRFDALGVQVDGFKEKVAALEAQGMSANEAFTEAFLQQAEEQIEIVGDAADSAAGSFDRLEASLANVGDRLKKESLPVLEDLARRTAEIIEAGEENNRGVKDLDQLLARGVITVDEYNAAFYTMWGTGKRVGVNLEYINELMLEHGLKMADISSGTKDYVEILDDVVEQQYNLASSLNASGDAANYFADTLVESLLGSIYDYFDAIEGGIPSFNFADTLEGIDWLDAGGDQLLDFWDVYQRALDNHVLTQREIEEAAGTALIAQEALAVSVGETSPWEAAQTVADATGMSLQSAFLAVNDLESALAALDGLRSTIYIDVVTNGVIPQGTGSSLGSGGPGAANPGAETLMNQSGREIIMPPTATNDTGYIRAGAGERVQVTSKSSTYEQLFSGQNGLEVAREMGKAMAMELMKRGAFEG